MKYEMKEEPLSEAEVLEIVEKSEAIEYGHFISAAFLHLGFYVNKRKLLASSERTWVLCWEIARRCIDEDIDVVVGPATAGIKIATIVALLLYKFTGRDVDSLFTEKDNEGRQMLNADEADIRGKRAFFVDDVGTTGGTLKEVISVCCKEYGALAVGCGIIVDRSDGRIYAEMLGVEKFFSLTKVHDDYSEEECPYCALHKPINTRLGHGMKYLEVNPEKAEWTKK